MDFMIGTLLGLIAGGAAMYYIQPQIKLFVAKAFGTEQALYDKIRGYLADIKVAQAQSAARTKQVDDTTKS